MKTFISWSGELSGKIASELSNWLPKVIQSVKPFYSTNDIGIGNRWFSEIENHLSNSQFGILCVTHENANSSWLMFEAGALSKNIGQSRVIPILFGINHADISGPLTQFQAIKFNKDDFKLFIQAINDMMSDSALPGFVLNETFDKWWPDLEKSINHFLLDPVKKSGLKKRSNEEILDEVLDRIRHLDNVVHSRKLTVHPNATKELVGFYIDICNGWLSDPNLYDINTIMIGTIGRITFIEPALKYLLEQTDLPEEELNQLKKEFTEAKAKIKESFHTNLNKKYLSK